MGCEDKHGVTDISDIPEHRRRRPNLYIRTTTRVVEAPAQDLEVAEKYISWPDRGPLFDGKRLTILTAKRTFQVDEEVRVIHVFESTKPGERVYVMGPKDVYGENVDGLLVTQQAPDGDQPWVPGFYDGMTVEAPAVDYNYEITSYRFQEPGIHRISWELGSLRSNVVEIEVVRRVGPQE